MIRSHWRMFLVHAAVHAELLALLYYWLGLSESTTSKLLFSFVLALVLLATTAAAYGSAFVYFGSANRNATDAWQASLRRLLPLTVSAIAIGLLYWALAAWAAQILKPAFPIASWLTLKLQKPVKPASVSRVIGDLLWIVRWVILPLILVPITAAVAEQGWSGFRSFRLPPRRQWLLIPAVLFAGVWLPLKLIYWVPAVQGFAVEAASFAARGLTAWLLFCAAGLLLAFVMSGGRPRATQPNTAASPFLDTSIDTTPTASA